MNKGMADWKYKAGSHGPQARDHQRPKGRVWPLKIAKVNAGLRTPFDFSDRCKRTVSIFVDEIQDAPTIRAVHWVVEDHDTAVPQPHVKVLRERNSPFRRVSSEGKQKGAQPEAEENDGSSAGKLKGFGNHWETTRLKFV